MNKKIDHICTYCEEHVKANAKDVMASDGHICLECVEVLEALAKNNVFDETYFMALQDSAGLMYSDKEPPL